MPVITPSIFGFPYFCEDSPSIVDNHYSHEMSDDNSCCTGMHSHSSVSLLSDKDKYFRALKRTKRHRIFYKIAGQSDFFIYLSLNLKSLIIWALIELFMLFIFLPCSLVILIAWLQPYWVLTTPDSWILQSTVTSFEKWLHHIPNSEQRDPSRPMVVVAQFTIKNKAKWFSSPSTALGKRQNNFLLVLQRWIPDKFQRLPRLRCPGLCNQWS